MRKVRILQEVPINMKVDVTQTITLSNQEIDRIVVTVLKDRLKITIRKNFNDYYDDFYIDEKTEEIVGYKINSNNGDIYGKEYVRRLTTDEESLYKLIKDFKR